MNGVIVIDKPAGKTSFDVVDQVRRTLGVRKAGHTGTLDPLATGVLPVCLNEATKLVPFLMGGWKVYRATLLLGVRTDTLDRDGQIERTCIPSVTPEEIAGALKKCVGRRLQQAPRYSALKFKGKALYRWARQGVAIDPPSRIVEIDELTIASIEGPYATFTVRCSKGTYIRSLCAEAGEALGCGGCMSALRRTRSGSFREEAAVKIADLKEGEKRERLSAHLMPSAELLPGLAVIDVDSTFAERLRNGYQPDGGALSRYHIPFLAAGDVVKITMNGERLVAVARMLHASDELASGGGKRQAIKILRILND